MLELKELDVMMTKRTLAKGMVLNENQVVGFRVRNLENESLEFEAKGHVVG